MPGVEDVHESSEPHETDEEYACPVEVHRRDVVRVREKRPDEAPARVDESNNIDRQTGSTETPTTLWKWEAVETTVGHAA